MVLSSGLDLRPLEVKLTPHADKVGEMGFLVDAWAPAAIHASLVC